MDNTTDAIKKTDVKKKSASKASKKVAPKPAKWGVKTDTSTKMVRKEDAERNWWVVDASQMKLGRLATQISRVLRGKHKPSFTPHTDCGDFVVVTNVEKIEMSGSKWLDKKYYRHSRFFGSMKEKTAEQMRESDPAFILRDAVWGMLPDNKTAFQLIEKLKAYKGPEHPHSAQKPQPFPLEKRS